MDVSQLRSPYANEVLTDAEVETFSDPFPIFHQWFQTASDNETIIEPNSMCLSTSTPDGMPSSRYVLMKSFSAQGLKFYSNYESRKAIELSQNPNVCVLFYWQAIHRQVRIEGTVSQLSEKEATEYYRTRPKTSQASAAISLQSRPIATRAELETKWKDYLEEYKDKDIPKPSHWGGYLLEPRYFEFWQGHTNRLHDRVCFKKLENGSWIVNRLYP